MKSIKVLMLGWEFPPVITGGLGKACHGLVKSLSAYADITLIIPTAEKSSENNGFTTVGLNYYGLDKAAPDIAPEPLTKYAKVKEIKAELNPYPVGISFQKEAKALTTPEAIRALYSTSEPYGANIMQKVATYAEVVSLLAEDLDFDIIHAHDWITFPAAVKLKEKTGKPLVLHIHSLETDRVGDLAKGDWNTVFEIEKISMQKADRLIPVSNYTKECAVLHYGIAPEKFYPVHNAIDPEETYRIPNESGKKLVLFLGRVTFQKGPEFMVETARKLVNHYPDVLFFVAGIGDLLDDMKRMVAERNLDAHFIFGGFLSQSQVKQILAQADVYFMPSISEPFGLSALEAARFDVPCVISSQSGVSEVLPNALKADFWDTDKFANYIYGLLNYEGIREDITKQTRADIAKLSWDDSAIDVMEIYHTLV